MAQSDSSAVSQAEEPTADIYTLSCTDCSFETTVEEDTYDVIEMADAHQDEYGHTLTGHFVNFQIER